MTVTNTCGLVLFSSLSLFQSRRRCSKFSPGSVLENWVSRPPGFCPALATTWVWNQSFSRQCAFFTGSWDKFLRCSETRIAFVEERRVQVSHVDIWIEEMFAKSRWIVMEGGFRYCVLLFSLLSISSFTFHKMKKSTLSQRLSLGLCVFPFDDLAGQEGSSGHVYFVTIHNESCSVYLRDFPGHSSLPAAPGHLGI